MPTPFPPSKIWNRQVDTPVRQDASYKMSAQDRAYIDSQIIGIETLLLAVIGSGLVGFGTANQFYVTNNTGTAAAWQTVAGDVSYASGTMSVTGIQNRPVTSTAPTNGQVYAWNGSAWAPSTIGGAASVTGTGLWHSTSSALDSAALHGTADQLLVMNHAGSDTIFQTLGGDATYASGSLTVTGFQGRPMSSTAPTSGQAITWNGSTWLPTTLAGGGGGVYTAIGGDLVNSVATAQYVSSISFNATGFGHGTGNNVAVNGTGTALNWVDDQIALKYSGSALLQAKAASTDFFSLGATPSTTGFIRVSNNTTAVAARGSGAFDLPLIGSDGSNYITLGGSINNVGLKLQIAGVTQIQLQNSASDYIQFGGTSVSATGFIRTPNNKIIVCAMNAGATGDIQCLQTTNLDGVVLGGTNAVTAGMSIAGAGVVLRLGATSSDLITFGGTPAHSGYLRADNNSIIVAARNQAASGDIAALSTDASNNVVLATAGANSLMVGCATLQWPVGLAPLITQVSPTSETATHNIAIQASSAWSSATTNVNGGSITLAGGNSKSGGATGLRGGVSLSVWIFPLVQVAEVVVGQKIVALAGLSTVTSANMPANSGDGVIFIANCNVAPAANASGGGILYASGGALTWRGSSGTITTLAPA